MCSILFMNNVWLSKLEKPIHSLSNHRFLFNLQFSILIHTKSFALINSEISYSHSHSVQYCFLPLVLKSSITYLETAHYLFPFMSEFLNFFRSFTFLRFKTYHLRSFQNHQSLIQLLISINYWIISPQTLPSQQLPQQTLFIFEFACLCWKIGEAVSVILQLHDL